MVLCKIDKYYNHVKFQVLWPRLKVGSSTVMFTVRNRIQIASPENIRKNVCRALFVDQNLLECGSKSCFAYLPSFAGYIARSCSPERKIALFLRYRGSPQPILGR